MNEEEKYLFDLRGYLSIENALSECQIRNLNNIWDKHIQDKCAMHETTHRFSQLLGWGQAYVDLIDNPSITLPLPKVERPNKGTVIPIIKRPIPLRVSDPATAFKPPKIA